MLTVSRPDTLLWSLLQMGIDRMISPACPSLTIRLLPWIFNLPSGRSFVHQESQDASQELIRLDGQRVRTRDCSTISGISDHALTLLCTVTLLSIMSHGALVCKARQEIARNAVLYGNLSLIAAPHAPLRTRLQACLSRTPTCPLLLNPRSQLHRVQLQVL